MPKTPALLLVLFFAARSIYAQGVPCESIGDAYRECRVAAFGKIALERELSNGFCSQGQSWGTRSEGVVWVSMGCRAIFAIMEEEPRQKPKGKPAVAKVTCESKDGARNVCPADTKFGVALVKTAGEAACVLDESWGFDDKGIWVSGGCSGLFALGGFRLPPEAVPATAQRLRCESQDGKLTMCAVDASHGAGLVRQIGDTACVLNRTWGYDKRGIWVTAGCRAEFAVAK